MTSVQLVLLTIFTTIIVSLVWARFKFFKVTTDGARSGARFYDPAVAIQILATYYYMSYGYQGTTVHIAVGIGLYLTALTLFWWAIKTAKSLDFAFSSNVGEIITTGPFSIVRHPFYVSYILTWGTSTLMFNSIPLWITLFYLMAFYFLSAQREEKVIEKSAHAEAYAKYKNSVGMFLPRVTQWKSWLLRLSKLKME